MAVNDYEPIIQAAAQEWNVDPLIVKAVMHQESKGNPTDAQGRTITSPTGVRGLMQITGDTAKHLGVTDVTDPTQAIYGGTKYLSELLDQYKDPMKAIYAYNGGTDPQFAQKVAGHYKMFAAGTVPGQTAPTDPSSPPVMTDDLKGPDVKAFIVHHTGGRGTAADVQATLNQRGLGAQYVMDRDGTITNIAGRGAHHIMNGWGAGDGLNNGNTVGMEVIAKDDTDVTPAQVASFTKFASDNYPNTPVYGHGEVNPGHKQATEGMTVTNAVRAARQASAADSGTAQAVASSPTAERTGGTDVAGPGAATNVVDPAVPNVPKGDAMPPKSPSAPSDAAPDVADFLKKTGAATPDASAPPSAAPTQPAGEDINAFLARTGASVAPVAATPAYSYPEQASASPAVKSGMPGKSTPNPRGSPTPSPAEGVSQGLGDAITGGAQLLTHILPASVVAAGNQANNWLAEKTGLVAPLPAGGMDQVAQQREADYQAGRTARGETGFDMPRAFGNMLDPVNSAPQAVLGRAATGIGRIAQAGMSGAVAGGLNPVTDAPADFWAEKSKQAGMGAVGGAALGTGAEGVARVISPQLRPAVNLLAGEGVKLTPGQMAGGLGKTLEDMGTSVPLLGSMIQGGQRRSLESFNRVAINKTLAPIGETLPTTAQVGHGAVDYAATKLGDAYDALLPKLTGSLTPSFQADLAGVKSMGSKLPTAQADQLDRIIQNEVIDRFQGGTAPGDVIKQIESKLGHIGTTMGRSEDYDVRNLGQGVQELQASLRRMVQDQNPQYSGELSAINNGWANLIRIQKAAGSAGARDGVFTPAQLINAVKSSDPSKGKASYARGNALMQDFAGAARDVLPSTVPDSGTPGRLMMANMLTAAGAGHFLNEPLIPAGAAVAGAAAAVPYSAFGMNLLRHYATAAPQTRNLLAGGVRLATPQLAGGAGASTR